MVVITYGVSKLNAKTRKEARAIYDRELAHSGRRLIKITKGPHPAISGGYGEVYYVAHWKDGSVRRKK